MTKKSKKETPASSSMSTMELTILLIVIVILVMLAYVRVAHVDVGQSKFSLRSPHEVSPEKYKQLYDRALHLTNRYKSISNSSVLPEELQALEKLTTKGIPVPPPTTSSSSGASAAMSAVGENVVLGMAQDTDSKNLAVFCKSLRRLVWNVLLSSALLCAVVCLMRMSSYL